MRTIALGMLAMFVLPFDAYGQELIRLRPLNEAPQASASRQPGPIASAVERESARLTGIDFKQTSQPVPPAPTKNWVRRHPALTGLLIGAGAGAVLNAVTAPGPDGTCGNGVVSCEAVTALGALVGAGLGAATGFVISRW